MVPPVPWDRAVSLTPSEHQPGHAGRAMSLCLPQAWTAGWGTSHPKKAIRRLVSGFCHLAASQSAPSWSELGGTWPPGLVSAGGAGGDPAVFTYHELLPMGTVTQAALAFAVLIGRRRSQPSDESLQTEVRALPTTGPPSGLGDTVPSTGGHSRGFGCASPKEKATEEPLSAPGLYLIVGGWGCIYTNKTER